MMISSSSSLQLLVLSTEPFFKLSLQAAAIAACKTIIFQSYLLLLSVSLRSLKAYTIINYCASD